MFPNDLRTALESQISTIPFTTLATAARELSLRYRNTPQSPATAFVRSELEAMAYLAYRVPATFAATSAVLSELRDRRPDLNPRNLLDVGSGPGTACYAAVQRWPNLTEITALERDPHMIEVGKRLAVSSFLPAMQNVMWQQADLVSLADFPLAEVTIAAYIIGELPAHAHPDFLQRLWQRTTDSCVVIEPGTPAGSKSIGQSAEHLHSSGAHIVAPFPPNWNCVEGQSDWCHFSQRVPRTSFQRRAKEAQLSYEDEKFSYVVASRRPGLPIAARVLRHPQVRTGHLRLVLCTREGVKHVVISRGRPEAYRHAKKLTWGSAILPEEASLYGLANT